MSARGEHAYRTSLGHRGYALGTPARGRTGRVTQRTVDALRCAGMLEYPVGSRSPHDQLEVSRAGGALAGRLSALTGPQVRVCLELLSGMSVAYLAPAGRGRTHVDVVGRGLVDRPVSWGTLAALVARVRRTGGRGSAQVPRGRGHLVLLRARGGRVAMSEVTQVARSLVGLRVSRVELNGSPGPEDYMEPCYDPEIIFEDGTRLGFAVRVDSSVVLRRMGGTPRREALSERLVDGPAAEEEYLKSPWYHAVATAVRAAERTGQDPVAVLCRGLALLARDHRLLLDAVTRQVMSLPAESGTALMRAVVERGP
jgi:hypothetical protein